MRRNVGEKRKGKCVTFSFITFNAKVFPKSLGEGQFFCAEVIYRLSKLIFTVFVSCSSRSNEIVEK